MNKKIKELANNSGMNFDGFGEPILGALDSGSDFLEIYTKNIIQECCSVMEDKDSFYGEWMGNVIKEHFGIEDE